jgi:diguanylate cyclase (GGDEF)-like protein/PAS domain S-box-containing protein
LRASQQIIEGILNAIPARVFWKDKQLVFLGCNAAFARDAGFADPKDIIGKDDYQMGWRAQADLYRGDDRQIIESGCPRLLVEEPQTTPEGDTISLLTSKIPLRNSQGEISGVLGTYLEVTERKRAEEKIEFLAAHDPLTGLLNRRSLEEMLNRTIARAKRGTFSSLLFMDLDNFKNVNDTVGHAAGDEVLITLAGLFKDAVRTEDVAFRVGGDEFAFLLDGIFGRDALLVAERLRSAVEAHPFQQEGRVFPLSLSIGLIQIDGTLATGELMSQADGAMYRAKAQGKNRVVVA